MIPFSDLIVFAVTAFFLVLSPGPNMIYLVSRSLSQGTKAGLISLLGVICGFIFHILMVSLGLTTIFLTLPVAFYIVKFLGVGYFLYLAFNSLRSKQLVFENKNSSKFDTPLKLFYIGLLTNILNPKIAVFYLSFFPQFIRPEYGSIFSQSLQLGMLQIMVSFLTNFLVIIAATKLSVFIVGKSVWKKVQKWFMATVLAGLALKMALSKVE